MWSRDGVIVFVIRIAEGWSSWKQWILEEPMRQHCESRNPAISDKIGGIKSQISLYIFKVVVRVRVVFDLAHCLLLISVRCMHSNIIRLNETPLSCLSRVPYHFFWTILFTFFRIQRSLLIIFYLYFLNN